MIGASPGGNCGWVADGRGMRGGDFGGEYDLFLRVRRASILSSSSRSNCGDEYDLFLCRRSASMLSYSSHSRMRVWFTCDEGGGLVFSKCCVDGYLWKASCGQGFSLYDSCS